VALSQAGVPFYSISDLVAALNIPIARLQWLAPVLSFQYYDPVSALPAVSVNRSTVAELIQIPQISPELATAIVNQREQDGSFTDLVNFQQRLRLSGELIGELMHYLQF
jgi:DNA uptake protein ComE-like DNA-binding protein